MKRGRKSKRSRPHRFRLLLYDRVMVRVRIPSLVLAVLSLALWFGVNRQWLSWPSANKSYLLLSSGVFFTGFWIFTWLSPILAYVQILEDHLRMQTPFYHLKIPYKQIHNTRPVEIQKLFPPSKISSSQHEFLKPFYGRTALAVDLQGLPPPNFILRLFFHRFTFSPDSLGIVLLVDNWFGLSHQLSTRVDAWRMAHSTHPTRGASDAADILNDSFY
jgi:extradiol dioxygenase family protein